MSKIDAAFLILFVNLISALLGSSLPLGWLCAKINPTESDFKTVAKRIRISTKVPAIPPCEIWQMPSLCYCCLRVQF